VDVPFAFYGVPIRALGPDNALVLIFESLGPENELRAVSGAPEDWSKRLDTLPELFARARRPRPDEPLNFVDKIEVQLARRIALDLATYDAELVLQIVRWRYVGMLAASRMYWAGRHGLTADEYEALRDYAEAELVRWVGRSG
jgi:hypothetical protein